MIVEKKSDTWLWLSHTVVPVIYPSTDYNNQRLSDNSLKFIENGYAYKLGPPRLRQIRIIQSKCLKCNCSIYELQITPLTYNLPHSV